MTREWQRILRFYMNPNIGWFRCWMIRSCRLHSFQPRVNSGKKWLGDKLQSKCSSIWCMAMLSYKCKYLLDVHTLVWMLHMFQLPWCWPGINHWSIQECGQSHRAICPPLSDAFMFPERSKITSILLHWIINKPQLRQGQESNCALSHQKKRLPDLSCRNRHFHIV